MDRNYKDFSKELLFSYFNVIFALIMLASLIIWIIHFSNLVTERDTLAELVENPCALVVEYTKDGEISENHLNLENGSFEVASFDDGTPVSICLTIFNKPEEDAKRFYITIGKNVNAE